MCSICPAKAIQRGVKVAPTARHPSNLGIAETAEWYNSFVLVLKLNGRVRLCLDPVRLNQALIRLDHRGPTFNDILPKLNNAQHFLLKMQVLLIKT